MQNQFNNPTRQIPGLGSKKELTHWIDSATATQIFGINPCDIGKRHLSFWIVNEIGCDELNAGAEKGDLCIKTLDTGNIQQDIEAKSLTNFVGTSIATKDKRIRYYYFRPLTRREVNILTNKEACDYIKMLVHECPCNPHPLDDCILNAIRSMPVQSRNLRIDTLTESEIEFIIHSHIDCATSHASTA